MDVMRAVAVTFGGLIVAAFCVGLFWLIAHIEGWKVAAIIWGGAIAVSAVLASGVFLLTWGLA